MAGTRCRCEHIKFLRQARKYLAFIRDFPSKGYERKTDDGYPSEFMYDEYAYKRMIDSYREAAGRGLEKSHPRKKK